MKPRNYYVYIVAGYSGALYTGVTNNLPLRLQQHRASNGSIFAAKYKTFKLVHFESTDTAYSAISREKIGRAHV